jgi:hypothetical protein
MPWAIYTPSTRPFEVVVLCRSAEECKTPRRLYPIHPIAKLLIHRYFVWGMWRPPSSVEKLLSGGGIKVTKDAWRVPKWQSFVVSLVVLLGETW